MYVDELIDECMKTHRYVDFAELAKASDNVVTASRLRDIANPAGAWDRFTMPRTLVGLAKGLKVPTAVLLHAQAWSIGRWLDLPELHLREREPAGILVTRERAIQALREHADMLESMDPYPPATLATS